jgi:transposase
MIRIEFTQAEIEALHKERRYHPDPRVQQRMETLYLKALGLSHQEIGRIVGISPKTLRSYLRLYQAGGLEALKQFNYRRQPSALEAHRESLEAEFKERPPQSINEAVERIETLTKIRRSPSQVGRYLRRLGMKRRKVGQIPAKADPEAQADFLKKSSNPA